MVDYGKRNTNKKYRTYPCLSTSPNMIHGIKCFVTQLYVLFPRTPSLPSPLKEGGFGWG
jgi:hypothetical protein